MCEMKQQTGIKDAHKQLVNLNERCSVVSINHTFGKKTLLFRGCMWQGYVWLKPHCNEFFKIKILWIQDTLKCPTVSVWKNKLMDDDRGLLVCAAVQSCWFLGTLTTSKLHGITTLEDHSPHFHCHISDVLAWIILITWMPCYTKYKDWWSDMPPLMLKESRLLLCIQACIIWGQDNVPVGGCSSIET
jgi:hypothetical protein